MGIVGRPRTRYRRAEMLERVKRLSHLLERAKTDAELCGFRGGYGARCVRSLAVARWRAELADLNARLYGDD